MKKEESISHHGRDPEMESNVAGPLEGMKILDLGVAAAGPVGPTLLAELGAEVIKVELAEGGTMVRRVPPLVQGVSLWKPIEMRNKQSVTLDMHTEEGQRLVKELVREYDIVSENYRPGTLERWNLGYKELKQANEQVILVRVSGFGQSGPYSRRTSYDTIGSAMGGMLHLTGLPGGSPMGVGMAYCDYTSAAFNALAMLVADCYRRRSGQGQWADVAQYESVFRLLEYTVAAYDRLGQVRGPSGNRHPSFAPSNTYQTQDGRWVAISAGDDRHFERLTRVMEAGELARDPRFATPRDRAENGDLLDEKVADWVRSRPLAETLAALEREGVPFSPVYDVRDIFEDPHLEARQDLLEVEEPCIGRVKVPNTCLRFSATPGRVRDGGPLLGQDNELLSRISPRPREMGSKEAEGQRSRGVEEQGRISPPAPLPPSPSAPLEGLRVLDLGPGLAASFACTLLADLGADVIRVEEPGVGDLLRYLPPFDSGTPGPAGGSPASLFWAVEGRNKRSVTLDLGRPPGAGLLKRLAATSDVVGEGFRPGTLERWGLGYEELRAVNERIILLRVSGFGQDGPYAPRPAYDHIASALGGLAALTGSPDGPPLRPGIALGAYLPGIFGAIGILAALYHRDRKGEGQWIDLAMYAPFLRFSHDNIPAYDRLGIVKGRLGPILNVTGRAGVQVVFPAGDGRWIALLTVEDRDFARLCRAIGREELPQDPRFQTMVGRVENCLALNEILCARFRDFSARELVELLWKHEVPASLIYTVRDSFEDPHYRERGSIVEVKDPQWGKLRMQGVVPRFSLTPGRVRWAGPPLGQHNQEIYRGLLGLSEGEAERLGREGII